ncbi:MAG: glycosyltransferase family 39 protein [PVC group bacterium]
MSKDTKAIIVLFILALLIRLISLLTFGFIDSGGGTDSVTYLLLAKNLFTGEGLTEFGIPHTIHPPLYPIVIGLFWQATGELILAGHLVSTIAGSLLVLPVYCLAKYLYDSRTALYAGIFTAIFPVLIYGSVETFSESLYTFLLISGVAVFWLTFCRKRRLGMLPAGILIGLAFLTHPSGLAFLPLLILFLFVAQFSVFRSSWRRFLLRALIFVIGFGLTCLPFWIFVHRVTGNWQVSGSSHFQDLTLRLAQARGTPVSSIIFRHMEMIFHPEDAGSGPEEKGMGILTMAVRRPGEFMEVVRYNLKDGCQEIEKSAGYLGIDGRLLAAALGAVLVVFFAFFIANFLRRRSFLSGLFLLLLFTPVLVFVIVTIEHRYFYVFVPLGLIVCSRIMAGWESAARASRSGLKQGGYYLLAALLILGLLAGSAGIIYRKWKKIGIPYEYKLMGEWMKTEVPGIEKENVMMFRMGVSHYAGCRWNVFYWGDYSGLPDYLRRRGIQYLVIDDYNRDMIHPDLWRRLSGDDLPPGFRLVEEVSFEGRRARLLRFLPDR